MTIKPTSPKMCCENPPLIFSGKNAYNQPVHSVACLFCGKVKIDTNKDGAIRKFNEAKHGN